MNFAELIVGVDLVDTETETLKTKAAESEKRIVALTAALDNAKSEFDSVTELLSQRKDLPSVTERAQAIAEQLEGLGFGSAAIRAVLVTQFGKASAAKPAKPPSASAGKDKKVTSCLPSAADQDSILSAIREAGAEGIRMETLYEKFSSVVPDGRNETNEEVSRQAVSGTVHNALVDKLLTTSGQARGMRYHYAAPAQA